jgi:hypothetical protein
MRAPTPIAPFRFAPSLLANDAAALIPENLDGR